MGEHPWPDVDDPKDDPDFYSLCSCFDEAKDRSQLQRLGELLAKDASVNPRVKDAVRAHYVACLRAVD